MSTILSPIPVEVQEHIISADLNSSMLQSFLFGIYTMVFGGTIYLYLLKRQSSPNNRIVLSAISFLYFLALVDSVLQWYFLDVEILTNGDTRDSIFYAALGGPQWTTAISDVLFTLILMVSDALMIWRCYHVWGQSLRSIVLPSVLFVGESTLSVLTIVLDTRSGELSSQSNAVLINSISCALVFVALGATLTTTFLIGYRVYSVSKLRGSTSRKLFNGIIVVIVESAAIYSLALCLYAMTLVAPSFTDLRSPTAEATYFMQVLLKLVAGVSPTILVARIATTTSPSNSVVHSLPTHISRLHFGSAGHAGHSGSSVSSDNIGRVAMSEFKMPSCADKITGETHV